MSFVAPALGIDGEVAAAAPLQLRTPQEAEGPQEAEAPSGADKTPRSYRRTIALAACGFFLVLLVT